MLISHKGHTDTIQVYSVTVMTHVKALQAGHSSQGTSEPITPVISVSLIVIARRKRPFNQPTLTPKYGGGSGEVVSHALTEVHEMLKNNGVPSTGMTKHRQKHSMRSIKAFSRKNKREKATRIMKYYKTHHRHIRSNPCHRCVRQGSCRCVTRFPWICHKPHRRSLDLACQWDHSQ